MERAPGPSTNFVRGKSGHVPFWPGGLEDITRDDGESGGVNTLHGKMKNIPPGFTRGLNFDGEPNEDLAEIASIAHPDGTCVAQV